jgi:hypothetical protein
MSAPCDFQPFAIELDQFDLVDPEARYLRPKMFDGKRGNLDAEISVTRLEHFPDMRNIIGGQTVRYLERQQAFSWLERNR